MASKCAPEIAPKEVNAGIDISKSVFDDYKTAKYHKLTDFVIGQVFRQNASSLGWTPISLTNPKNAKKIREGIRTVYENSIPERAKGIETSPFVDMSSEAINDINDIILPNFDQFIGHYFLFNSVIKNVQTAIDEGTLPDETTDNDQGDDSEIGGVEEEKDLTEKYKDRSGNDTSPIELVSPAVKLIFRLIPKVDPETGEIFKDQDGLPTTADFGPTFNKLLVALAGTKDPDEMFAKLTDPDILRVVPEAKYVAEILKVDKSHSNNTRGEYNLLNEFYQQFSKPTIQLQSAIRTETGDFIVVDEITGNVNGIREQFTSSFQIGDVNDNVKRFLKQDELFGTYIGKPKGEEIINHLPSKPTTENEMLDFLSLLGIKLSGVDFLDSDTKKDDYDAMLAKTTGLLYDSLVKRLNAGQQIFEPLKELSEKFNPNERVNIRSERKSINELVQFESKYSTISPSLSTRTAKGELAYLMSLDNQLSAVTYHLNNAETLDDLMKTSPFRTAKYDPLFKVSGMINFLFKEDGTRRVDEQGRKTSIDLANLSGYKNRLEGRSAQVERELSARDKLIQDLNMMWVEGKTDTIRPEVSHSFFTISMIKQNGETQRYFPVTGFTSKEKAFQSNNKFRKIMFNYLTAELTRIKSYKTKLDENPGLPEAYSQFSIFYETLEQDNPALRDDLKAAGNIEFGSAIFNRFMDAFENQMVREVQRLKDEMDKLGIDKSEAVSQTAKRLINGDINRDELISNEDFDSL
jgi:hypothetical protein